MLYLSNKQVVNMKVILPLNQFITRHFVLLKIVNLQPLFFIYHLFRKTLIKTILHWTLKYVLFQRKFC